MRVRLQSWGRELIDEQSLAGLPTNAFLVMRNELRALDPNRGLRRVRVVSTALEKRQFAVDEKTTALQLKEMINGSHYKGDHRFWKKDGSVQQARGTTILAKATAKASEKEGTDAVSMGEELVVQERLMLEGKSGAIQVWRLPEGKTCNVTEPMVTLLSLPAEQQRLDFNGRMLRDADVLYEVGVRHDDSIALEFKSPVEPKELTLMRAPPVEKVKKPKSDKGKGKKKK